MGRVVAVLVVLAVVIGGYLALSVAPQQSSDAPAARPAIPVLPVIAQTRAFRDSVAALGTLRAWESVAITASVTETVASIYFEDGQRVEEGDLLARLRQDEEQAALREQQEVMAEQEREVARLEDLASRNQVAQTELDQRKTMAAIARSKIAQMKARIADRTITAPFSGVLGLRQVSAGALVNPGEKIVTLDDISRMRLDFTVSAPSLGFIAIGQPVNAITAAYAQSFAGTITAVDTRIDPGNRSLTARASFANADGRLRPGMLMSLELLGPEREALMVPEEALISRADKHFVWVLQDDQALRVEVALGSRVPGWVEVTAGLERGQEIVLEGLSRLRGEQASVVRVAP